MLSFNYLFILFQSDPLAPGPEYMFFVSVPYLSQPGAVARSDLRPPGMRTVGGSILRPGNILSWTLVMK